MARHFRERENSVRSDLMSRAWAIFRETYDYPLLPFSSIDRKCFAWSLRKAWAEKRQAAKLAALSNEAMAAIIANTQAEIDGLRYRPWGHNVRREQAALEDAARPYVKDQFRRAGAADAFKLAA